MTETAKTTPPVSFGRKDLGKGSALFGIATTFVLHFTLIFSIVWATRSGGEQIAEEIEPKMLRFEKVDLLALGEEKPPNALPRIANPEPAVRPPDEINLAKPEEPVVDLDKKEKKEEKEDAEARKRKMLDALSALSNPNRPTNEDIPEGHADGVIGGDISDAALANLMGTYASKLVAELGRYWELPSTIPPEEVASLSGQVTVYVRLAESGHIVSYRFLENSTNPQFDASIDRVLRRFQTTGGGRTLPMPDDPSVKEAVVKQGLNLKSWEYTGQ